jgi:FAD/FMN-containing dehydrogenase
MISEAAVKEFQASLRGQVLTPTDGDFEATRRVFNAMVDKRPALIARCAESADVVSSVRFARDHDLVVSVRGGGHSVAGNAVCDGGLMIDLSAMKGVRVDPEKQTAVAEPGLTLGEFDRGTQAFGMATTLGVVSNTGIAGLTLGGGIGWLNGKYGLACDNLLSVDVVTADGQLLRASDAENSDLFWGVRGGGGNFGVVTSFEYGLHSVETVLGGMMVYPLSRAGEVLRFFDEFAAEAPDELSTLGLLVTGPDGQPVVAIVVCHSGPLDAGESAVSPLRSLGPAADLVKPMRYLEMQQMLDEAFQPGLRHYWKSSFLPKVEEGAADVLVKFAADKPSPFTGIGLQQMHGAAGRVDPSATAFAHRRDQFDCIILSVWPDGADDEKNIRWARDLFEEMQPFLERGVYVNNLGDEGDDRIRAAYGPNYDRLVELKDKYDPTNFFRLNQNTRPSAQPAPAEP